MTVYNSLQGTLGIDDCYLDQSTTTTPHNTTYVTVGQIGGFLYRGLLRFDLTQGTSAATTGATVTAGTVRVFCEQYNVARTLVLYKCLRLFSEADATWNKYDSSNNWTTVGCGSDGNDYVSTELGSVAISGTGAYDIALTAAGVTAIQSWIDTPSSNCGFVLRNSAETTNGNRITASEGGTAANYPQLNFQYTAGAGSAVGYTLILNT